MSVVRELDSMIYELERVNSPAEHIIMGKKYFYSWLTEISRQGEIGFDFKKKKYRFSHRNIPVIICESEILEAVPNAKKFLGE
jgi:hypothetical protein